MKLRLLLFALAFTCVCAGAQTPTNAVTTQVVKRQALTETVSAYGQLVPAPGTLESLSAAQGGRVSAVLVTAGAKVAAGQVLVKIAPTSQTLAAFETARGDAESAAAKLKQAQTLFKNGLATRADLVAAEGQATSAQAAFQALTAAGVTAKGQILRAATAGVVSQISVTPGEWANAGTSLVAVAPLGALWVRLGLTPGDAAKVRAGDAVQLTPVFGGAALESRVAKVNAQADAATGLIDAEVPVKATASGPFSGEWVSGIITVRSVEVPAVPRSAVLKDDQGDYVFVVRKNTAHRVNVKALIRADGLVGVSGLEPGAVVVTLGNFELNDGDAVRISTASDTGQ